MSDRYVVTTLGLNLRSAPVVAPRNVLAVLPQNKEVELLDRTNDPWWKVETRVAGTLLAGYVSAKYLAPADEVPAPPAAGIRAVHLTGTGRRASPSGRAFPLGEADVPRVPPAATPAERAAGLRAIVEYLEVESSSRYAPTSSSTFCNIYAYDVTYLAGAYLPRVWWMSRPLVELAAGRAVRVAYGETVRELNANSLFVWLGEWGPEFGWTRSFELGQVQERVNAGGVAVISAEHREANRSGHITVVVPEGDGATAERTSGVVVAPLQSQAGSTNKKSFADAWWVRRAAQYREVGFWLWG